MKLPNSGRKHTAFELASWEPDEDADRAISILSVDFYFTIDIYSFHQAVSEPNSGC